METVKWYEKSPGNVSTMRIIAAGGAVIGAIMSLSGTVGMFLNLPSANVAMTTGAGLFAAGNIAKAFQAQAENR